VCSIHLKYRQNSGFLLIGDIIREGRTFESLLYDKSIRFLINQCNIYDDFIVFKALDWRIACFCIKKQLLNAFDIFKVLVFEKLQGA
jgi:hypothetical protein